MSEKIRPFVKWAGGKGSLIPQLEKLYPDDLKNGHIRTYVEPFIGGGAVLIDILQEYKIEKAYTFDINIDLINTYNVIKTNVEELIMKLKKMETEYLPLGQEKRKKYFYHKREQYNSYTLQENEKNIERAAEFIYLNRTCFNGLYRVNKEGKFNVPIGSYKNPTICDENNLKALSQLIKNVEFLCGDYKESIKYITEDTFVYFDPPYKPLNITSAFTSYTKEDFNDENQRELAIYFKELDKKRAKLMLSNSNPKNVNEEDVFFDRLYQGFKINEIYANRMINAKSQGRGKISEIVVTNYKVNKTETEKEREIMSRNFEEWLSGFEDSISSWKYYTDFDKVYRNVNKIKKELNLLNSLIGSKNVERDFKELVEEYPKVLRAIPILIAKRNDVIIVKDASEDYYFNFKNRNYSIDDYIKFMRNTGIFELLESHLIANLYDYVTGVEVGLDSNARKNRTGHAMEDLVESYIVKAGFIRDYNYFKELKTAKMKEMWNIDLTAVEMKLEEISKKHKDKKAEKKFDYVVKTDNQLYVIETNFYNVGGSKLNETARSYKMIQEEIEKMDGVTFIWFTDGKGWKKAKNNLKETFNIMPNIYNISDMKKGIMKEIFI